MKGKSSNLEDLFSPKSVAVVGASGNVSSAGYFYTRHLLDYGFCGDIFLINPKLSELFGLKVYPNIEDVPKETIDYVISCIPAEKLPDLVKGCGKKKVKLLHLFTARMKETGRVEKALFEDEIVRLAKSYGIRVLGPNCVGLYFPKVGLSFSFDLPKESGWVSGVFQSGGMATEFVRYGSLRGLRFSKVISYGNGLDIDESELFIYLADDPSTKVIASYIEGVKDGRRFLRSLSYACRKKPVVILKGGRSSSGKRSTLSHTASLAGKREIFSGVFRQSGACEVLNIQELIDQTVAFSFLPPIYGKRVGIAGGGGGKSVMSSDIWEEAGFFIPEPSAEFRKALKGISPNLWDWIQNPIDVSILQGTNLKLIDLLKRMGDFLNFDLYVVNITEDDPFPKELWKDMADEHFFGIVQLKREKKPVIVIQGSFEGGREDMELWRWRLLAELRKRIISEKIAVFPSADRACKALKNLIWYYKRKRLLNL